MEEKEIRILKEALTLLFYYDRVPSFREDFNRKMSSGGFYLGRPVFFYVQVLVMYSPLYRRYYRKFTRTTSTASRIKFFVKRQPNMIEDFLRACYHNGRTEYWKLWNTISPPGLFSASELETINRMEKEQDTPNKNLLFTQFMTKINAMGRSAAATPQYTQAQTLAYSLQAKILKYGKFMQTTEGREQLINSPQSVLDAEDLKNKVTITQEDLDFVLKEGLIAGADVSSKEDPKRFLKPDGTIDQDKHFEATFEAYYQEVCQQSFKQSLPPDIQKDLARFDPETQVSILQGLKTGKRGDKNFRIKKVGKEIQYFDIDPKTKDEFVIIPKEISSEKEVTIELPIVEPKSETREPTEEVVTAQSPVSLISPVSTPLASVTTQAPETIEILQTKEVTAREPQKEINIPNIPSPKTLSGVKTQVNLITKQMFNRTKEVMFQTRALTSFISNAPAVKNGAYAVLVGVRGGLGAVSKGILGTGVKGVIKTGVGLIVKTGAKIAVGALIPGPGWVVAAITLAPLIIKSLKKIILYAMLLTLFLMFGLSFLINSIFKGGAALNPISQAESAGLPTITPGGPTPTPGGGSTCDTSGFDIFGKGAVTPEILTKYIATYKSRLSAGSEAYSQFDTRANFIVDQAQAAGFNPAIFLAFWVTESANSSVGRRGNDLGCRPNSDQITTFEEEVLCAVGKQSSGKSYAPSITAQCANGNTSSCAMLKSISDNWQIGRNQCPGVPDKWMTRISTIPIKYLDDYVKGWGSPYYDCNNINSINNFQTVISGMGMAKCSTTPPSTGNLAKDLQNRFGLIFTTDFEQNILQSFFDILVTSETIAPKFKTLFRSQCSTISVQIPSPGTFSHADSPNCILYLITGASQVTIIHELGHFIGNANRSLYQGLITQARTADSAYQGGFLTYYSKFASEPTDFSTVCYAQSTGKSYLLDEEFADSVTYFINSGAGEINMGSNCKTFWSNNPYQGNRYPSHYKTIAEIMGAGTGQNHVIVLDPGHGNPDPDTAEGKSPEGSLNLVVAKKTRDLLAKNNITAKLSHESNIPIANHYQSLQERVNRINSNGGEIFVSIHFDSSNYSFPKGPRSYYNENRTFSDKNKRLAELVSSAISTRTGTSTGANTDKDTYLDGLPLFILGPTGAYTKWKDDATKTEYLPESKINPGTSIPGILNEYFTKGVNYPDTEKDTFFVEKISYGYCDGILRYLTGDNSKNCN